MTNLKANDRLPLCNGQDHLLSAADVQGILLLVDRALGLAGTESLYEEAAASAPTPSACLSPTARRKRMSRTQQLLDEIDLDAVA